MAIMIGGMSPERSIFVAVLSMLPFSHQFHWHP
jgi:hypothetical protein